MYSSQETIVNFRVLLLNRKNIRREFYDGYQLSVNEKTSGKHIFYYIEKKNRILKHMFICLYLLLPTTACMTTFTKINEVLDSLPPVKLCKYTTTTPQVDCSGVAGLE